MPARPFIPVANTVKIEVRFTLFGQQCENVFYVTGTEPMNETNQDAVALIVKNVFLSDILPSLSSDLTLQSIKTTGMDDATSATHEYTADLPHAGGYTGTSLPGGTALAVHFGTNSRGRGTSGRQYVMGIPDGANVGNNVTSTFQNAMRLGYISLMETLSVAEYTLSVVSFVHNKTLRMEGVSMAVTSVTVDPAIDSQRRRLAGRGR